MWNYIANKSVFEKSFKIPNRLEICRGYKEVNLIDVFIQWGQKSVIFEIYISKCSSNWFTLHFGELVEMFAGQERTYLKAPADSNLVNVIYNVVYGVQVKP